ncbi:MAG: hypothetical protein ACR650_16605 [Methylocystis sp.]
MSDLKRRRPHPGAELRGPLLEAEEIYHLWYEFYWYARFSEEPIIDEALEKAKEYYAPWGDEYELVEKWWTTHRHLFEERHIVRRLAPNEPAPANMLVVQIPLSKSPTKLTEEVGELIQAAWAKENQNSFKSKNKPTAPFKLSEGAEPDTNALTDILNVYNLYLRNETIRGEKLLNAIRLAFAEGKALGAAAIPDSLKQNPEAEDEYEDTVRAMRNMRRYIQKARKIMVNVANREFPGKYSP